MEVYPIKKFTKIVLFIVILLISISFSYAIDNSSDIETANVLKTTDNTETNITSQNSDENIGQESNLNYKNNITTESTQQTKNIKSDTSKHNSKIKVEDTVVYHSDEAVLKATIVDKTTNTYITSGKVAFKINGITVGHTTIKNGKATYTYNTSQLSAKKYTITCVYGGSSTVNSYTSTGTLNILKHKSNIKVEAATAYYSNNAVLKATIVDKTTDSYITSGKVAFKINGITVGHTTIKNGKATYTYNTSQLSAKKYTITCVYGGSSINNAYTSTAVLTVKQMKTSISLSNVNAKTNSSTTLKATVKDSKGNLINSGYVTFKINSESIAKVSVKNGIAQTTYTTPNIVKNYTITAVYANNNRYSSSSATSKLIVSLKVNILKWGSVGNIKKNTVLYNNLSKSSITDELVSACLNGTPYVCLGNGNGETVVIVAGIHGNELSSQSAAVRLINNLATKDINGTLYIFPFVAPSYTGNNTRTLNGVNLNSVANKAGTISNKVYQFAKSKNAKCLGDYHCTKPGGKPGKNAVFGSYNPTSSSATLAKYIASKTSSSSIIYTTAGTEYPGALEDYCNLNGITSVTCEVKTQHGTIASGTVEKSYSMMTALLNYYKLL